MTVTTMSSIWYSAKYPVAGQKQRKDRDRPDALISLTVSRRAIAADLETVRSRSSVKAAMPHQRGAWGPSRAILRTIKVIFPTICPVSSLVRRRTRDASLACGRSNRSASFPRQAGERQALEVVVPLRTRPVVVSRVGVPQRGEAYPLPDRREGGGRVVGPAEVTVRGREEQVGGPVVGRAAGRVPQVRHGRLRPPREQVGPAEVHAVARRVARVQLDRLAHQRQGLRGPAHERVDVGEPHVVLGVARPERPRALAPAGRLVVVVP